MSPLAAVAVVFVVTTSIYWFHWLGCRLKAERCPRCGSKWQTELVGEWGAEQWQCHACDHYWERPYGGESWKESGSPPSTPT
jgi:hypothetical protein